MHKDSDKIFLYVMRNLKYHVEMASGHSACLK